MNRCSFPLPVGWTPLNDTTNKETNERTKKGAENAGVEDAGADCRAGKHRSDKNAWKSVRRDTIRYQ